MKVLKEENDCKVTFKVECAHTIYKKRLIEEFYKLIDRLSKE